MTVTISEMRMVRLKITTLYGSLKNEIQESNESVPLKKVGQMTDTSGINKKKINKMNPGASIRYGIFFDIR